jgi:hypothetical protein
MSVLCQLTNSRLQQQSCFVTMSGTRRSCKSNSGMTQLVYSKKLVYHHHHHRANQTVLFPNHLAHVLEMRNQAPRPLSNEASPLSPVYPVVLSNVPSAAVNFHEKSWTRRPWPWVASTDFVWIAGRSTWLVKSPRMGRAARYNAWRADVTESSRVKSLTGLSAQRFRKSEPRLSRQSRRD